LETRPDYNVVAQCGPPRGCRGEGPHTPPLCFYNFKSQTGCVSSATLFCGNQVSAFVPPLHPTQFFAGPPRVRLLSASCPPQFFAGPLRVRPMSAPIFCGSASCSVLSASCPHQFLFGSASCPPPVRLVSAPVVCGSASCPPAVRLSFLRVRLVSASCPPQLCAGPLCVVCNPMWKHGETKPSTKSHNRLS
jgi:hypothetical protein